jgi:hypothetical protein
MRTFYEWKIQWIRESIHTFQNFVRRMRTFYEWTIQWILQSSFSELCKRRRHGSWLCEVIKGDKMKLELYIFECRVKLRITYNAFCIVRRATAHSKQEYFVIIGVAESPPGFHAGWSDCMYFFVCSSGISVKVFYSWGYSAVSKLSLNVLLWGGLCLSCCTRRFRTANSTPLISISRHLAQIDNLGFKVIALKDLFQSSFAGIWEIEDCRPSKSRFSWVSD